MKTVQLAHGTGGTESNALIKDIFFRHLGNDILLRYEDAAVLDVTTKIAMTTDSFTVSPLFFNGGDIGKLAICGTCNDLAMMGAKPSYLSCGFIIEEGMSFEALEKIVMSMKEELLKNNAMIVTGDTKVVPKGLADGVYINTTGVGNIIASGISSNSLAAGDLIIVSRSIGEHGAAIFAAREGIDISTSLKSDCASLWPMVQKLIDGGVKIKALRDATRGGISAVLNEWATQNSLGIEVLESSLSIKDEVAGICELLGFEATHLANEGTFVMALHEEEAKKALAILRDEEHTKDAAIVGRVMSEQPQRVILKTPYGTSRYMDPPTGELLPRIC
jgi:hydrogenase expression/formation protein HypE